MQVVEHLWYSCCDKRPHTLRPAEQKVAANSNPQHTPRQVRVFLDGKAQDLLAGANPSQESASGAPITGFGIVFMYSQQGTLCVHNVMEGSPAAEARPEPIAVGDILFSIDSCQVYRKDLRFVNQLMAQTLGMGNECVLGFFTSTPPKAPGERGSMRIKTVVLYRQGVAHTFEANETCSAASAENISAISSEDAAAADEDLPNDQKFAKANQLRHKGNYTHAVQSYRKILANVADTYANKHVVKAESCGGGFLGKENL